MYCWRICFAVGLYQFYEFEYSKIEKRGKEVGIRKAIGSRKGALIFQFLSESFLVVILAFGLSIFLVVLSLSGLMIWPIKFIYPFSNPFFGYSTLLLLLSPAFWPGFILLFNLSSFQAVKVLKGTLQLGRFAAIPRKTLVVVQFTTSVILIIGTIVVYQQIQYAQNRPIGYNRESLITVSLNDPNYQGKQDVIKNELLSTDRLLLRLWQAARLPK